MLNLFTNPVSDFARYSCGMKQIIVTYVGAEHESYQVANYTHNSQNQPLPAAQNLRIFVGDGCYYRLYNCELQRNNKS